MTDTLRRRKRKSLSMNLFGGICLTMSLPLLANQHSLVIAIDGLRGDGIFNAATPNLDKLIKGTWAPGYRGAFAHYAQTMKDAAPNSGPNHVGIMTGVTATKSRVTGNGNVASGDYKNYPHYQTLLERHDPTLNTAYLVTWGTDMQIANQADLKIDADDATNTRNVVDILSGNFASANWPLGTRPDSVFLFLDDIDHAGHACCFTVADEGYRAEIVDVDNQIGQILTALRQRENFANENWQIVITSDHGGRGSSHGIHAADNYTIPFLVVSKAAGQGYLRGVPHNYDAAPTALAHMGVPIPENLDGKVRGGEVMDNVPKQLIEELVTYLPFEGNYQDASGQHHHGEAHGKPEIKYGGKFGRYVAIDGHQEYINLGNPAAMDFGTTKDFTLFTWFRVRANQDGDPVIVGNKDWRSGSNRGALLLANEGNGDDLGINLASSASDRKDFDPIDYSFDGWWLLAATFDRDGAATLYAGSPEGHLHTISGDIQTVGDLNSGLNWHIGQDGTGSHAFNLKADLDDFAVWSRALSLNEVQRIFNKGEGSELSELLYNRGSKYLNSEFDFVNGETYRVKLSARIADRSCGFRSDVFASQSMLNAYWDCTDYNEVLQLKVVTVRDDLQGNKWVTGNLVSEQQKAGLEWDSTPLTTMNQHNARLNRNSTGDSITIHFVADGNDTSVVSPIGAGDCRLTWDSLVNSDAHNAIWNCQSAHTPVRFELVDDTTIPKPTEPPKLIAHFPLDGDGADVSGAGNHGSKIGNLTYVVDRQRHYAEFNNSAMLVMAQGSNLPTLPVKAMTVSAWVNTRNADSWGGFTGIVQDNGSYEKGWLLGTRGQKFSFALASKGGNGLTYLTDNNPFTLNTWYHLAATYDGKQMTLYVNGKQVTSSRAQQGDIDMPSSGWWQIGSYKDDNEDYRHDGGLDDIKIFDQALNSEAIHQLYSQVKQTLKGDLDQDQDVDRNDIALLMKSWNKPMTVNNRHLDINGDGSISALDSRLLVTMCTRTHCATE